MEKRKVRMERVKTMTCKNDEGSKEDTSEKMTRNQNENDNVEKRH